MNEEQRKVISDRIVSLDKLIVSIEAGVFIFNSPIMKEEMLTERKKEKQELIYKLEEVE